MEVPTTDPIVQEGAGVLIHAFAEWASNLENPELSPSQIVETFGMAQYLSILTHAVNTKSGRELLRTLTETEDIE